MKNQMKKWALSALLLTGVITFGGCAADKAVETSDTSVSSSVIKESTVDTSSKEKEELAKKEAEEKAKQAELEKKKKEEQAS